MLQDDGTVTNAVVTGSGSDNGMNAVAAGANFTVSTVDAAGTTLSTSALTYAANSGANIIAGVIDRAGSSVEASASASNSATLSGLDGVGNGNGTVSFTLNTQTDDGDGTFTAVTSNISATITDQNDLSALVSAINGAQASTGITAEFTTAGNKASITLNTLDGRNIGISAFAVNGASNQSVSFDGNTLTEGGTVAAVKTGAIELTSSRGAITLANQDAEAFGGANSSFSSMAAVDVSTAAGAQSALSAIDAALNQVNSARADLGAYQNRFESTISSLAITSENLSAARSRIQDADFAAETASLTRAQILQQAGVAMVSQANVLPQTVLSLLQ